jgi:hypothetical protein
MIDEDRAKMAETYWDGGVSSIQTAELGTTRPTIRNFLAFCEKYNDVPFRSLSSFGGLEFVFSYFEEFESYGISGDLLAHCVDGDPESIRTVSRRVLEVLADAEDDGRKGKRHLVSRKESLSPTSIRAFILAALDAQERYGQFEPIAEFLFLLSIILMPGIPEAEDRRRSAELKSYCGFIADAYYCKFSKLPSFRWIAKKLDVSPSTVSRLFNGPEELAQDVQRMSKLRSPLDSQLWQHVLFDLPDGKVSRPK